MKRVFSIVAVLWIFAGITSAQTQEVGIGLGVSNFLGDLGKKEPNGRTYFGDIEASLFRPAVSVFYRNHFNPWFALKAGVTYGRFEGNDQLANTNQFRDDAWYRNYRNLHFRSNVFEFAVTGEVNLMRFVPGSSQYRMAPYVFTGVGFFKFNPKAKYHGEWVALQPLGTEGQGMPQYPDRHKYSLVQAALPIGIGFKFNMNEFLTLGFEMGHRFTFTDYIDDVSTTYVSKEEFIEQYGFEKGVMAYELSRRSSEIDPEESYGSITKPGEVRGNPGGNDGYLFSTLTLSYKFANSFSEYSFSGKKRIRKHPVRNKKIKKYRRHIKNKTW